MDPNVYSWFHVPKESSILKSNFYCLFDSSGKPSVPLLRKLEPVSAAPHVLPNLLNIILKLSYYKYSRQA